jgi:hypothetical protein
MTPALRSRPVYFALIQAIADAAAAEAKTGEQLNLLLDHIDDDIDAALKRRHQKK